MSDKIVFIEPVCRGSRLQWLWLLTGAVQNRYDVVIFAREDCETEHFKELMSGLRYELRKVPGDFGGAWLPRISRGEWRVWLQELHRFDREQTAPYILFFLALDDYFSVFVRTIRARRLLKKARRCLTVKYRVACLTASVKESRQWIIGRLLHLICRVWKMECIVLDERLRGSEVGGRPARWLPDPWFGRFSAGLKESARREAGYAPDDFVALVIGRQDERKGFSFLLQALPEALEAIPALKVRVCGRIAAPLREPFENLIRRYGPDRICHQPEFIPEEVLPETYASASVVLLPYAPFFTATSGVLPRAAASGVPVAASAHGLVGHRVRTYHLGETFVYGEVNQFVQALERLQEKSVDEEFLLGCRDFAATCSEQAFKEAVRTVL